MTHALPLDFSLRNVNDEAVLMLGGPQDLKLKIHNTSPTPLVLNHLTKAHHFSLRFRAGVLHDHTSIVLDEAQLKHWELEARKDEHEDIVVGLRYKTPKTLAPDQSLHLKLQGLRGELAGGTRATRIELSFDHIRNESEEGPIVSGKPRHHQMVLTMTQPQEVHAHPLLEGHFVGETGNVVLNDGKPHDYSVELRLTNTTAHPLYIKPTAAFHLTFAGGAQDLPGALATTDALQKYVVSAVVVRDASVADPFPLECKLVHDQPVTWALRAPENSGDDLWIGPAGHLQIKIERLVTGHGNGPSNVHVRWLNLGYLDKDKGGELVATLQKSPVVITGHKFGIGTPAPQAALDVHGDVNIQGRITSPVSLDVDTLLNANEGLALGSVKLVAPILRATQTRITDARHYTAEEFEAFEGWPTSLASIQPLTFTFPFPSASMSFLAARASVRLRVTAHSVEAPKSRCTEFASLPIAAVVTVSGATLTVAPTLDVVTVTDILVQGGAKSLAIASSLCAGPATELARLREMLEGLSVQAGSWAHSFGRLGPKVAWTIDATCSVSVLFADIGDPSWAL